VGEEVRRGEQVKDNLYTYPSGFVEGDIVRDWQGKVCIVADPALSVKASLRADIAGQSSVGVFCYYGSLRHYNGRYRPLWWVEAAAIQRTTEPTSDPDCLLRYATMGGYTGDDNSEAAPVEVLEDIVDELCNLAEAS
jgi:hypothetical protein